MTYGSPIMLSDIVIVHRSPPVSPEPLVANKTDPSSKTATDVFLVDGKSISSQKDTQRGPTVCGCKPGHQSAKVRNDRDI